MMYGWMERPDRDATCINQVALFNEQNLKEASQ